MIGKMKKQQNKQTEKLNYEKVYEAPLSWCPLFGYLPEIEEIHFHENAPASKIAIECLSIIHNARDNFGFDYRPSRLVKYAVLPELKTIFPEIDSDIKKEYETLRFLFQNLDYLALKTVSIYDHPFIIEQLNHCGKIDAIPNKPIGRVSNLWNNCFSVMASDIRVVRILPEHLLEEAQKITGVAIKLNYVKLFSLYAILEAWLILTALFFKTKLNAEDLLYHREKLADANDLLNLAAHHLENEIHGEAYVEIEKIAKPYRENKRKYALMGVEKRKERNAPNHEKWRTEARKICERIFKTPRIWESINYRNVAYKIIENLTLPIKNHRAIVEDKEVRAIVNEYQKKMKLNSFT